MLLDGSSSEMIDQSTSLSRFQLAHLVVAICIEGGKVQTGRARRASPFLLANRGVTTIERVGLFLIWGKWRPN